MRETQLLENLDELSFIAQQTKGASFTICHDKEKGLWCVRFYNPSFKTKETLKPTNIEQAVVDALSWLKQNIEPFSHTAYKYTMRSKLTTKQG